MKLSARELILLVLTLAAALFGVSAVLARPRLDALRELRRQQKVLKADIAADRQLIGEHDRWSGEFESLKVYLPQYPADQKMDIHWLSVMDRLAAQHGVLITKRQAGDEARIGDIYELPIEVRDWEGSLAAIVHFLFDLQSQGAMLDVRQLFMKPNDDKTLRGRFTLFCAYTRQSTAIAEGRAVEREE